MGKGDGMNKLNGKPMTINDANNLLGRITEVDFMRRKTSFLSTILSGRILEWKEDAIVALENGNAYPDFDHAILEKVLILEQATASLFFLSESLKAASPSEP